MFIAILTYKKPLGEVDKYLQAHRDYSDIAFLYQRRRQCANFTVKNERKFRLCGSGGFAGYYGWYYDSRIGGFSVIMETNRNVFLLAFVVGCNTSLAVKIPLIW